MSKRDTSDVVRLLIGSAIAIMFILIGIGVVLLALRGDGIPSLGQIVSSSIRWGLQIAITVGLFFAIVGLFFALLFSLFWRPWTRRRYWRHNRWFGDPAVELLRERYAKGEITKEQFEQMIRDLEER